VLIQVLLKKYLDIVLLM